MNYEVMIEEVKTHNIIVEAESIHEAREQALTGNGELIDIQGQPPTAKRIKRLDRLNEVA